MILTLIFLQSITLNVVIRTEKRLCSSVHRATSTQTTTYSLKVTFQGQTYNTASLEVYVRQIVDIRVRNAISFFPVMIDRRKFP